MKLLTDDHWELIVGQIESKEKRIKELEAANLALLDRILIQQGQVPLDMSLSHELKQDEKAHNDLMETLTAEEIGEEPKDDVES